VPRSVPRDEHLTAAEMSEPKVLALPPADHVEDTQRTDLRWESSGVTEPDEPALQSSVVLPECSAQRLPLRAERPRDSDGYRPTLPGATPSE
jgi:hypothetical protein